MRDMFSVKWIISKKIFLVYNLSLFFFFFFPQGSPIKFEDKIYGIIQKISPERNNLCAIVELCKYSSQGIL